MEVENGATGALKQDFHYVGVNPKRDFPDNCIVGDFHNVDEYDICPKCSGKLSFKRGTEVGQVFKLGKKYSEKLDCKFLDDKGVEQHVTMGCYGIGVGRTMAASVEQNNDDRGIIWPMAIAPYHVVIIPVNMKNSDIVNIAEDMYKNLLKENFEVILDDTDERAGVKFANADLIGYPIKIVIGSRTIEEKTVDFKIRATGEELIVPLEKAIGKIKELLL
jgi:prolyl-tRNA synthetase